jgi:hypothetical protein
VILPRRVFVTVTRWAHPLYVEAGRLSALEYWWTNDHKPHKFPPASAIGNPVVM